MTIPLKVKSSINSKFFISSEQKHISQTKLTTFLYSLKKIVDIEKEKENKYMIFFKSLTKNDIPAKKFTHSIVKYNFEKKKIVDRINNRLLSRNIKPKNEYDGDFDTLVEELNNNIYKKPWNRLHPQLKINRIQHYIKFIKNKYNLSEKNELYLNNELSSAIRERLITKKTHIDYDHENCKIISIINLEYCETNNKFTFIK